MYPPVARLDVAMLCDPWLAVDSYHHDFEQRGLSSAVLGFRKGCDFTTHKGYKTALSQLELLRPRWLVCNVPQGPPPARTTVDMDEKASSKIKKFQKVVRHLLLLSRQAADNGQEVIWLTHPSSSVWHLPEVMAFWKARSSGPLMLGNETVKVTSTSAAIQNTFSTTTSEGFFQVTAELDQNRAASQNTFSTTTSGASESIWTWLARTISRPHGDLMWAEDGEIFPIDTSVLETLEPPKLQKLMEDVKKLHRRFGHPSNRLLVKNLQSRNADPLVIAAASKLECDECLEGRIKMPSPAVNLERSERLWSCLQVDGWDMKFNGLLHHFVLLVDEASGYAVIRELFRIPDDQSRNATGQEIIDTIQEAWIQYFGYPETVKMDLEGAHRSKKLREYFQEHGVDLVPAPAEHHETIAQAERAIGSLRLKAEAFLRGSPVDAKHAAVAMIAAHNSLARVHGFSPLQWALGRDWSLEVACWTRTTTRSPSTDPPHLLGKSERMRRRPSLSIVRESKPLERRTPGQASTRSTSLGDLIFSRRLQHPADLPANSMLDYPRLRTARWYGPARVLACETKIDGSSRRPSAMLWAIAAGRLKKFHASQVRHASESERLVSNATSVTTFPWTFSSLTSLLQKGAYDDETRAKRRTWGRSSRVKNKARENKEAPGPSRRRTVPTATPQHVRDAPSDEEMVPDQEDRLKRPPPPAEEDELDIDRLLDDVTYLPSGQRGPVTFQEQRASHERSDRPWHVQREASALWVKEDFSSVLFSVTLEIPEDPKAWKKILKDPSKFMVKNVQKGVEVAYHKLNEKQKLAMNAAKTAEIESWLGDKVAKAACPSITEEQCVRMRWLYTFKAAGEEPTEKGKAKAKARIVVLGFSDPSLLERTASSPAMSRLSKMLLLNMATARRWKILAGDVKTAFLQAKPRKTSSPVREALARACGGHEAERGSDDQTSRIRLRTHVRSTGMVR